MVTATLPSAGHFPMPPPPPTLLGGPHNSPSLCPIHYEVVCQKGWYDIESRALEAPPSVENGSMASSREGILSVGREGVGCHAFLR